MYQENTQRSSRSAFSPHVRLPDINTTTDATIEYEYTRPLSKGSHNNRYSNHSVNASPEIPTISRPPSTKSQKRTKRQKQEEERRAREEERQRQIKFRKQERDRIHRERAEERRIQQEKEKAAEQEDLERQESLELQKRAEEEQESEQREPVYDENTEDDNQFQVELKLNFIIISCIESCFR